MAVQRICPLVSAFCDWAGLSAKCILIEESVSWKCTLHRTVFLTSAANTSSSNTSKFHLELKISSSYGSVH